MDAFVTNLCMKTGSGIWPMLGKSSVTGDEATMKTGTILRWVTRHHWSLPLAIGLPEKGRN